MSEHYYRVGVHGPPDPKKHPWVQARFEGGWWRLIHVPDVPGRHWAHDEVWFPVEAPPSELAPEPEDQGVEVDGKRWRINGNMMQEQIRGGTLAGKWATRWHVDHYEEAARVAQALGLVPAVPASLVDWLTRCVERVAPTGVTFGKQEMCVELLDRIEAGEFGPVEPSVEWVTDRLPNDDEYPVLWGKIDQGHYEVNRLTGRDVALDHLRINNPTWRWVSLSVLLDAAGLGER